MVQQVKWAELFCMSEDQNSNGTHLYLNAQELRSYKLAS